MIFKLCWEDDRGPGYVETYDTEYEAYLAARDAEDWITGDRDSLAAGWEPLVV